MDTIDSREAETPEPAEEATDGRDRKLQLLLTANRELDKARAEALAEEAEEQADEEEDEGEEAEEAEEDSRCGWRLTPPGDFRVGTRSR